MDPKFGPKFSKPNLFREIEKLLRFVLRNPAGLQLGSVPEQIPHQRGRLYPAAVDGKGNPTDQPITMQCDLGRQSMFITRIASLRTVGIERGNWLIVLSPVLSTFWQRKRHDTKTIKDHDS